MRTFVALEHGKVRYKYDAQDKATGKLIVCVHGIGAYSFYYKPLAQHLVALGYRVLRFDLYGR